MGPMCVAGWLANNSGVATDTKTYAYASVFDRAFWMIVGGGPFVHFITFTDNKTHGKEGRYTQQQQKHELYWIRSAHSLHSVTHAGPYAVAAVANRNRNEQQPNNHYENK